MNKYKKYETEFINSEIEIKKEISEQNDLEHYEEDRMFVEPRTDHNQTLQHEVFHSIFTPDEINTFEDQTKNKTETIKEAKLDFTLTDILEESRTDSSSLSINGFSCIENPSNIHYKYRNLPSRTKDGKKLGCHVQSSSEKTLKTFKCYLCDFATNNQRNLSLHIKRHGLRKFKCPECKYSNNQKSQLSRHLLIHSNLRLFKCPDCNYSTNHKGNLTDHRQIHAPSVDKEFKCSSCDYASNRKRNLASHQLIHTQSADKEIRCSHCGYSSPYKSNLSRHMKKHDTTLKKGL